MTCDAVRWEGKRGQTDKKKGLTGEGQGSDEEGYGWMRGDGIGRVGT